MFVYGHIHSTQKFWGSFTLAPTEIAVIVGANYRGMHSSRGFLCPSANHDVPDKKPPE